MCSLLTADLACDSFHCFFFKQKTADEMRISDWSSDVCSSDLDLRRARHVQLLDLPPAHGPDQSVARFARRRRVAALYAARHAAAEPGRKCQELMRAVRSFRSPSPS